MPPDDEKTPSLPANTLKPLFISDALRTSALIMGPVCTGKSWSLRTLLPEYPDIAGKMHVGAGKTVLNLTLEPGFSDTLGDVPCDLGLHHHYIKPLDVDWDDLTALAETVNRSGDVTKIIDPNKRSYTQFIETYSALSRFVCQRCGKDFGPVDKLDTSYAVAMDGLTGLSRNAMNWTTGLKPHKSWPEYDAAGQQVENMLRKLVSITASFILIAHIDREMDAVEGKMKLTMHTIGNKLAPRLTKDLFSEIVYAHRDNRGKFWWSTVEPNMDLKARKLPFSDQIPASFVEVLGKAAKA